MLWKSYSPTSWKTYICLWSQSIFWSDKCSMGWFFTTSFILLLWYIIKINLYILYQLSDALKALKIWVRRCEVLLKYGIDRNDSVDIFCIRIKIFRVDSNNTVRYRWLTHLPLMQDTRFWVQVGGLFNLFYF